MTLLEQLDRGGDWPPKWEHTWGRVRLWEALRETNGPYVRQIAGWDTVEHRSRNYIVDSMPSKIAGTFAELIFGDDPVITAHSDSDQERLDEIIEANGLPSELQTAAEVCSSEGEVWWRLLVDREQADVPVIEWHSRLCVLPVFRGRTLIEAAFVSTIRPDPDKQETWRYFEIHGEGAVTNVLFKGSADRLGIRVDLATRPETADLQEEWNHGLPLLCGRVLNKRGRDPRLGVSDYAGVKDYLLALNEVATIGQENARLTLKKRVVIPDQYLDVRGNFPAGADVLISPSTDRDPDKPTGGLAQLEWEFDAQAFIAYKDELERTILGRVGLAKQLVDAGDPSSDGRATGTALRLRLIPTVLATAGKGRFWDDELPKVLTLTQRLDALPDDGPIGGFAYGWKTPDESPVVERTDPLPEDEIEEATRHSTLVGAEIESRRTAIQALHPDWEDERVDEELALIESDTTSALLTVPEEPAAPSTGAVGQPPGV